MPLRLDASAADFEARFQAYLRTGRDDSERVDAAGTKGGQVCTPGRYQFRFAFPVLAGIGRIVYDAFFATFFVALLIASILYFIEPRGVVTSTVSPFL